MKLHWLEIVKLSSALKVHKMELSGIQPFATTKVGAEASSKDNFFAGKHQDFH